MIQTLLLSCSLALAADWPGVLPAENISGALEEYSSLPPEFLAAKVKGRNTKSVREWRDARQNFAIFWTARPEGYRAFRIRDGRYKPLPGDLAPDGRSPKLHPKFYDASVAVNRYWRFLQGK